VRIAFILNGKQVDMEVAPSRRVIDLLREDLALTGTKEGCGTGQCGACVILVDNIPRNSCLILAAQLEGRSVTTIEGLAGGTRLHPMQQAFVTEGAVQCGFCTPGMILVSAALLQRNQRPSRQEIREALTGNLCRCTGYQKIIDAVEAAARAVARKQGARSGEERPGKRKSG
jgi:aerobic carbon-monoxide dehydrogenase small subunit